MAHLEEGERNQIEAFYKRNKFRLDCTETEIDLLGINDIIP